MKIEPEDVTVEVTRTGAVAKSEKVPGLTFYVSNDTARMSSGGGPERLHTLAVRGFLEDARKRFDRERRNAQARERRAKTRAETV